MVSKDFKRSHFERKISKKFHFTENGYFCFFSLILLFVTSLCLTHFKTWNLINESNSWYFSCCVTSTIPHPSNRIISKIKNRNLSKNPWNSWIEKWSSWISHTRFICCSSHCISSLSTNSSLSGHSWYMILSIIPRKHLFIINYVRVLDKWWKQLNDFIHSFFRQSTVVLAKVAISKRTPHFRLHFRWNVTIFL